MATGVNVWLAGLSGGVVLTILAAVLLLRWKKDRAVPCRCKSRVQGKVVLITGATKGIGYTLACSLACKGAVIYISGRNSELGQVIERSIRAASGNSRVFFRYLDLNSLTSIRAFVKQFLEDEAKLDILVNNAGVFYHPPQLTDDGFDVTFQTNYLGPYILTRELLGQIRETPSSRLVFISSEAHKIPKPKDLTSLDPTQLFEFKSQWDYIYHYSLTKLATLLFAKHIAEENPDILVSCVNPGSCWTPNNYRHFLASFGWWQYPKRLQMKLFMRTQGDGTQDILHAINAPQYPSGSYISNCESLSLDHIDPQEEVTEELLQRTQIWVNGIDNSGEKELESSHVYSDKKNV